MVTLPKRWSAGYSIFGQNWFDAGRVDGELIRGGEWWRTITALTLHSGARHLVGKHQGHGQIMVGCMGRIVADFVASASSQDLDIECMERSFVTPFFLDFSGPAP